MTGIVPPELSRGKLTKTTGHARVADARATFAIGSKVKEVVRPQKVQEHPNGPITQGTVVMATGNQFSLISHF